MHMPERKDWDVTISPSNAFGGFAPWRPGYVLPRAWHSTVDGEHLPYRVELDFTADEDGPQCQAVRFVVREEPLRVARLRHAQLGECIEMAIAAAAFRVEQHGKEQVVSLGGPRGEQLTEHGNVDMTERVRLASQAPQHHAYGTDKHLREVADIYLAASGKPTQAVALAFAPTPRSTVARWIAKARQRGFIPATTRGRATAGRRD
jgi:hypothetical protein